MWGGSPDRDRQDGAGQDRTGRSPAPLARALLFWGGFGVLGWVWLASGLGLGFGGGNAAARIREWLCLPAPLGSDEWAAGSRPVLAGACRHQSPAFLLGGHWQARRITAAASKRQASIATPINWATVSALFRKSSYRFKRAAGPCSGRYVSRHPRGRRRWPVSGCGVVRVNWDKIVDCPLRLGCYGTWKNKLGTMEDEGEASLNLGRINASRPLACLVSASAICKSRLRCQRHVPCPCPCPCPCPMPDDSDGGSLSLTA